MLCMLPSKLTLDDHGSGMDGLFPSRTSSSTADWGVPGSSTQTPTRTWGREDSHRQVRARETERLYQAAAGVRGITNWA